MSNESGLLERAASVAATNETFITITSAVAAIQSFHVNVSGSSHFALLLPGPKRRKSPSQAKQWIMFSKHRFQHSLAF